jgi:hypothetical protein
VPGLGDAGLLPGGVEDVEVLLWCGGHQHGGAGGRSCGSGVERESEALLGNRVDRLLKTIRVITFAWKKATAQHKNESRIKKV